MDKSQLITLSITIGILVFLFLCEIAKLVFYNKSGIIAFRPINLTESKVLLSLFEIEKIYE